MGDRTEGQAPKPPRPRQCPPGRTRRPSRPGRYVHYVGAVVRFVQQAALHDEAQDLFVGEALVRLLGQRGDLPEDDAEGPVTRGGEP